MKAKEWFPQNVLDAFGKEISPIELKLLGTLRILGKRCSWDLLYEVICQDIGLCLSRRNVIPHHPNRLGLGSNLNNDRVGGCLNIQATSANDQSLNLFDLSEPQLVGFLLVGVKDGCPSRTAAVFNLVVGERGKGSVG